MEEKEKRGRWEPAISVLVVDAEENASQLLARTTAAVGGKARIGRDAVESRELIWQYVFDLAFVDIKLPDGGGLDCIRELRTGCPEMAVVAMGRTLSREEELELRRLKVALCLIKPFGREQAEAVLRHYLPRT